VPTLRDRTTANFAPVTQARGDAYAAEGRVRLGAPRDAIIDARVAGGRPVAYHVHLDGSSAARGLLLASCSCPDFEGGNLCKHLWATIRALDTARLGHLIPGDGPLQVDNADIEDDFDDDVDLEEPDGLTSRPRLSATRGRTRPAAGPPAPVGRRVLDWRRLVKPLSRPARAPRPAESQLPGEERPIGELWYVVNPAASSDANALVVEFFVRRGRGPVEQAPLVPVSLRRADIARLTNAADRELVALLLGAEAEAIDTRFRAPWAVPASFSRSAVPPVLDDVLLPRLAATGRLGWSEVDRSNRGLLHPLASEPSPPWHVRLVATPRGAGGGWRITSLLSRGEESMDMTEPLLVLRSGLLILRDRIGRIDSAESARWVDVFRRAEALDIAEGERDEFLRLLWESPSATSLELAEELRPAVLAVEPRPILRVSPQGATRYHDLLDGLVEFEYGGAIVALSDDRTSLVDVAGRRVVPRDRTREEELVDGLLQAGFRRPTMYGVPSKFDLEIFTKRFPDAARAALAAGWRVEAEGEWLRAAGNATLRVTSGVDWFELSGGVDFGGQIVGLPELLSAAGRGEKYIRLSDGSRGLLPEEWLEQVAPLRGLGMEEGDGLRFRPSQALLLESLLAGAPRVDRDAAFEKLIARLGAAATVEPREPPPGFVGRLRDYQKVGLGWFHFLREMGFGGCLADDMGLGKTVQVLALLEERRTRRLAPGDPRRPSIVVAPRSLVHNWIEEATRFVPRLAVLDYTGLDREERRHQMGHVDLIVTTYGTVRRDILALKEEMFDYVILDEAQAIKNAASLSAKACRLLPGRHRLAMSGTPIENHLGELGSLFEFLNPGLLGRTTAAKRLLSGAGKVEGGLERLGTALRPFLLRRTKAQVLTELPAKTEQTLWCELEPKQRKLYDSMKAYYQQSLSRQVASVGLARSRIHVLEALLRLRQAACHPGLLDAARKRDASAKIDTLLESLREVLDEGHKALVFSQFTSLLAIVRERLDREKLVYEYLDGKTRDRKARVNRFQTDPDCRLFLISLKAGGQGLNLTAADYVFILDPWWNPAVEAQAVDRAHRIGQERPVFAYRLIARGTVEEKILDLQGSKRRLADAIVSQDSGILRGLTLEDLKILLS
jgi:superfamily II DNA or RNA helicase